MVSKLHPQVGIEPRKILILDSDRQSVSWLMNQLRQEGFLPVTGRAGANWFDNLKCLCPSLVLMNRRIPDDDGFSLIARIRTNKETEKLPIIFTCDHEDETDQVVAFRLGANDVAVKPFSAKILSARIRLQLGLANFDPDVQTRFPQRFLQAGNLLFDFWAHQVLLGGEPLNLTPTEFLLLSELAKKQGSPMSRKELAMAVGKPHANGSLRHIDSHIKALRQKLGHSGLVRTIQRKGYQINPETTCPANTV